MFLPIVIKGSTCLLPCSFLVHHKSRHSQQKDLLVYTLLLQKPFYTLGAQDLLKGRSDYCKRPEIATLPTFGTSITPNFEGLAGANVANIVGDNAISQHDDALLNPTWDCTCSSLAIHSRHEDIDSNLGVMTNTTADAERLVKELTTTFQTQPTGDPVLLLLSGSMISKGNCGTSNQNRSMGPCLKPVDTRMLSLQKSIPQMGIEELLSLDPQSLQS